MYFNMGWNSEFGLLHVAYSHNHFHTWPVMWCFSANPAGIPITLGAVEAQDKTRCLHFTLYTVYISKIFLCKEINNKITPG